LDSFWKGALLKKDGVVDLLKGTGRLEQMAEELGFWAVRLDNVFKEDVHAWLAKKMVDSFDPEAGGVSETIGRKNATSKGSHGYKVLNMCKAPCNCADMYGGLKGDHTIFQWGGGGSRQFDLLRPKAPKVIEEMVQKAAEELVAGVAQRGGARHGTGETDARVRGSHPLLRGL
jgi:hypothetical protein